MKTTGGVTFSIKNNTTGKARLSSPKVRIKNLAKGLTSQAGLIPVVKFLDRLGFRGLAGQHLGHKRGGNAVYNPHRRGVVDAGGDGWRGGLAVEGGCLVVRWCPEAGRRLGQDSRPQHAGAFVQGGTGRAHRAAGGVQSPPAWPVVAAGPVARASLTGSCKTSRRVKFGEKASTRPAAGRPKPQLQARGLPPSPSGWRGKKCCVYKDISKKSPPAPYAG